MEREKEVKILNSIREEFEEEVGEGYMENFGYSRTYAGWLESKYIRTIEDYTRIIETLELDLREK